jgi:hypothetical protein
MLLSGVLFVLFLAGCWLYCLTDAALLPAEAFPGWRKRTWIVVIAVTLIAGAIAWIIARRNWRSHPWVSTDAANLMIIDRSGADIVWYPHPPTDPTEPAEWGEPADPRDRTGPTGLAIPKGPDDDPEFLRQLAQRIHGSPTDPGE